MGVIEYFQELSRALKEASEVLSTGGKLEDSPKTFINRTVLHPDAESAKRFEDDPDFKKISIAKDKVTKAIQGN